MFVCDRSECVLLVAISYWKKRTPDICRQPDSSISGWLVRTVIWKVLISILLGLVPELIVWHKVYFKQWQKMTQFCIKKKKNISFTVCSDTKECSRMETTLTCSGSPGLKMCLRRLRFGRFLCWHHWVAHWQNEHLLLPCWKCCNLLNKSNCNKLAVIHSFWQYFKT